MANRRSLAWSAAMRDLRGERAGRAGVREERLRATAGLRKGPELTSWRGRSGRRYVVGVHGPVEPDVAELTDAVVIAVRRAEDGTAAVVDAASAPSNARARLDWLSAARARGATEMHVHLLADDETERRRIAADLAAEG